MPARKVGKSAAKPAGNRGKGRTKGTPNKVTTKVKEALTLAFEGSGGVPELTAWAKNNRTEFYKLYAKLLPTDLHVSGTDGGPIHLFVFGGQQVPF